MSDETGAAGTGGQAAGWYADPGGRYESRYWDGSAWTHDVVHQGQQGTDSGPIGGPGGPAPRIVPGVVGMPGMGGYGALGRGSGAGMQGVPLGVMTPRNTIVHENAPGIGTAVTVLGFVVFVVGLLQPWLGGDNAFTKPPGLYGTANQHWGSVAFYVSMTALWILFSVAFATIRYQPHGLAAFLYGGLIGWLVCRGRIDRDSPSRRSNWLAAVVLAFFAGIMWLNVIGLKGEIEDSESGVHVALGMGPSIASAGLGVAIVGVIIGRRRKLITEPKPANR